MALASYKVLILPNTACISQVGLDHIKRFVAAGGGLVALQESSLCDEFGTRRKDFGLADLFGAKFKGTKDFSARWPNYTSVTEITLSPHAITNDKVIAQNYRADNERLNYIGWATEVEPAAGTTQIGTRLADPKALPFLLLSERGKGRVAYFAADLSQAYFLAPYQYERKLLSNAIRWAAGTSALPVTIEAPLCVQAAFYEQSQPAPRVVVHLLNEINTSANRAIPENISSMREDVIPLTGIKLTFHQPGIKGVSLEPEHQTLEMRRSATPPR